MKIAIPGQGSSRGPGQCPPQSQLHTEGCQGAAAASGWLPHAETGPAVSSLTCFEGTALSLLPACLLHLLPATALFLDLLKEMLLQQHLALFSESAAHC